MVSQIRHTMHAQTCKTAAVAGRAACQQACSWPVSPARPGTSGAAATPGPREETKQPGQAVRQAGLSRGSGPFVPPALASVAPGKMCRRNACMT